MKVKISITLSEDILLDVDRRSKNMRRNRSEFIEEAVRVYIEQLVRTERDAHDFVILNQQADALNAEAEDVLNFQVIP